MGIQMYLVQPSNGEDDQARETIAEFIAQHRGFILMATSSGSLIAAFEERLLDEVKAHYLVEFASGVTLNPNAPGTAALQQVFAQNIATQLAGRGTPQPPKRSAGESANSSPGGFPPGYRPLRWPTRSPKEGGE